jgi:PAS domain S-box-containing protein
MESALKTIISRLYQSWQQLNNPLYQIPDEVERRKALTISSVLAGLLSAIVAVLLLYSAIDYPINVVVLLLVTSGILVGLFGLNYTRFRWFIPFALVFGLNGLILTIFLMNPDVIADRILVYLAVVSLIATIMINLRTMLYITTMNMVILSLVDIFNVTQFELMYVIFFNILCDATLYFIIRIRQRDLERVRESEQRYQNLLEAIPEPMLITDTQGRILDSNQLLEKLSGYKISNLIGTSIFNLVTPEKREVAQRIWEDQDMNRLPYRTQAFLANGKNALVEVRASQHTYKGQAAFVFWFRSVRDESEIERQKYEYELRYKALLDNTNDGVYIFDLDGNHVSANEQGLRMMGRKPDEHTTTTVKDNVAPDEYQQSLEVLRRLKDGEKLPVYQRRFVSSSGRIFTGEVSAMLVKDRDGTPLYIQSVVRDISERLKADHERLELQFQQERNQLMSRLINEFSHHVRTPLTNIKASVYLLERYRQKPNMEEKEKRQRDVIEAEANRLIGLLDDLLMLIRLDPRADSQTLQPISMERILQQLLPDPIGFAQTDSQHEWEYQPPIRSVNVYGNETYLMDAIKRLLQNAKEYTPPNGKISVSIDKHETLKAVCIQIKDNGVGIAKKELNAIFDDFYRAESGRIFNPQSTGLGLSISKRIVEIHRGVITVTSKEGQGSTFYVWLPTDLLTVLTPAMIPANAQHMP